jgi:quercetin dioxygenase-like cupin family protein
MSMAEEMARGLGRAVAASEGKTCMVVGDRITIKLTHADTGGAFGLWEELVPPAGGTPPHMHQREDEGFYILEGEIEFQVNGRALRALPGAFVFAPRDVPHCFKNVAAGPSRMMVMAVPGGFENFLLEANGLDVTKEAGMKAMVELGKKYGLEFLDQ